MTFSREDLASLVGTVQETALRLLSEFRDAGLITTRGSERAMVNTKELSQRAALHN